MGGGGLRLLFGVLFGRRGGLFLSTGKSLFGRGRNGFSPEIFLSGFALSGIGGGAGPLPPGIGGRLLKLGVLFGLGGRGGVCPPGVETVLPRGFREPFRLSGDATPFSRKRGEGGVLLAPGETSPPPSLSGGSSVVNDRLAWPCFLRVLTKVPKVMSLGAFRSNLYCRGCKTQKHTVFNSA